MATYKVIQDIEAEDKLVGPLTFRQFVYAGIAALNFYLSYLVASKGAPFMVIVFFPIGVVAAFFAWPWSSNQPTEIWMLAKIRFLLLPRRRIWDQTGMKELVTVTAPKKLERTLTNGLSQTEVKSRLRALADTIDTRGWAIKNVNVSLTGQPALAGDMNSDRLVDITTLPQPVPNDDIKNTDDMLDEKSNPVAKQFDSMMAASAKAHRQNIINKMQAASTPVAPPPPPAPVQPAPQRDYWFLNQPTQQAATVPQNTVTFNTQVVAPGSSTSSLPVASANPTQDEESFIKSHDNQPAFSPNMHGHLHVIQPLSQQGKAQPQPVSGAAQAQPAIQSDPGRTQSDTGGINTAAQQQAQQNQPAPKVTRGPDAAILDLARNDDLNVATLAREAQKRKEPPADEVVISLH